MSNRSISIILSSVMLGSIIFSSPPSILATSHERPSPTMEQIEKKMYKTTQFKIQTPFSWDHPGPVSPVIHPGSPKAAGMREEPLQEIDQVIEQAMRDRVIPGAVVYIVRRGIIVKHEAYGYARRYEDDLFTESKQPIPMRKDTIFDLASISKLFTTAAAMKLYEQGKFSLDDPVAKYIPEFAQNGKEKVTIRQLMTHTSGLAAWIPLYKMGTNREDRLQMVFAQPLEHPPGTTYTYSDLNMITLGALVERLSGLRLDQFVYKYITKPLGMNDTMYNPPPQLKTRIAATEYQPWTGRGLVWGEVHDENAWALDGVAGHAGVFSTAHDLAIFASMFLQNGKYGDKRILQPETVRLLMENQIPQFPGDDHGLGWELAQGWYMDALSESTTLGHTGYTGTSIVVSPNNHVIAILLTNRVHPTRNTVSTNPLRRQVARLTADAIPVAMPGKKRAWFAGYGDGLNAVLSTNVTLNEQATLTFDTWYRIEPNVDFGVVEVSPDGIHWMQVGEWLTGSSGNWVTKTVTIPAHTVSIRFRYHTDASINGRGWYVTNVRLTDERGKKIMATWESSEWEQRSF
ncbi:serine hydrolase domain-containing protein [Saccharococcus caldoxylosilyticus]|nr:serine hydrolase domain-containing protein [Parageobacillus caldoxylosilyticus]